MKKIIAKRLKFYVALLLVMISGLTIILSVFSDSIVFFYSPSEFSQIKKHGKDVKIGGIIKNSSIIQLLPNVIEFTITDSNTDIKVQYKGILPPLFREGQGIVAKGSMIKNVFIATELLTKHDETYKPKI